MTDQTTSEPSLTITDVITRTLEDTCLDDDVIWRGRRTEDVAALLADALSKHVAGPVGVRTTPEPHAPVSGPVDTGQHDERCESEFIEGPMLQSPCGCADRRELVAAESEIQSLMMQRDQLRERVGDLSDGPGSAAFDADTDNSDGAEPVRGREGAPRSPVAVRDRRAPFDGADAAFGERSEEPGRKVQPLPDVRAVVPMRRAGDSLTDLVAELRRAADQMMTKPLTMGDRYRIFEASDEIERLRGALRVADEAYYAEEGHCRELSDDLTLAEAALARVRELRDEWAEVDPEHPNHDLWARLDGIVGSSGE